MIAALTSVPGVRAAAPRVVGFGLLSTGARSVGAQLLGIDPVREAGVSSLLDTIANGRGLMGAPANTVLLGKTLADELEARPGDEVAVVTQAVDGSIGNELLHVVGTVRTGVAALDRSLALMTVGDLQALLALPPERVHEVAARVDDPARAGAIAARIAGSSAVPRRSRTDSWETLAPGLLEYLRLLRGWNWITTVIVGTFAALGVLNTMLMAVYERTREMGVLAALGLRPTRILAMVVAESACLALLGLIAGSGLGALGMAYFAWHGWDLSRWTEGLTIAGVLVDPVLRGTFVWSATPGIAAGLAAITLAAALIPAVRAARMKPVEALAAPAE
jgi:ABC-type lipoprotein release transport system permease subunit